MERRIRVSGILCRDNSILLVSHRKAGKEYWLLPGGGVDSGETLEEALKREFLEETGININIGDVLFLSDTIYPDNSKQIHHIIFEVFSDESEIKIYDKDIKKAEFMSLDDFSSIKFYPPIADNILDYLKSNTKKNGAVYLGKLWE